MKVIFNGELLEIQDSPSSESGWLPGEGIFETIKTIGNRPYALDQHLNRGQTSAKSLGIQIPQSVDIEKAVAVLLNDVAHPVGLLRISFSNQSDWLAVHLPYSPSEKALNLRLHPQKMLGDSHKRFPYSARLQILEESKKAGFDDAIVINPQGNICEGSVTNIIVQIDNQWVTPPIDDGLLPGIMREIMISNNLVTVQTIPISQLPKITSAFLLSSLRIAQPISSIEAHQLQVSHAFGQEIHALAVKYSVG